MSDKSSKKLALAELPRYVRWKNLTWSCTWVNERQVRLATIGFSNQQLVLMGICTFQDYLANGSLTSGGDVLNGY